MVLPATALAARPEARVPSGLDTGGVRQKAAVGETAAVGERVGCARNEHSPNWRLIDRERMLGVDVVCWP